MPVVTLDSLKKNQKSQSDSDEDGGQGNEYYTGGMGQGGSGSGLAVLAPSERGDDASNPLRRVMDQLQTSQAQSGGPVEAASDRRIVTVAVYRNGFTVDDGPLRTLDQPQNQAFMESLVEGYCPQELVQNGQPANVKLENRMEEDYQPSRTGRGGRAAASVPANFSAFSGSGATVGEISESVVPPIVPGTQGNGAPLIVNESGDVVRVQIRFPDGTREVAKFEKSHTVRHLITRVELLRPNLRPYHLLSGNRGPPKPIDPAQFDETLTSVGLAGALVTVKEQ